MASKRTFALEVRVTVDELEESRLIQLAREQVRGRFEFDGRGGQVAINPEEFIASAQDALVELLHQISFNEMPGVELSYVSCEAGDHVTVESGRLSRPVEDFDGIIVDDDEPQGELDEFETGTYVYRWPNGDCSIVCAGSRQNAILALDEWGAADASQLYPIEGFMADFNLTDEGQLVLSSFGEQAQSDIWETCYPDLGEAVREESLVETDDPLQEARERVRKAVDHERTRLLDHQERDEASTELGKDLARTLRASGVVADAYVGRRGKQMLEGLSKKKGKPN